MLGQIASTMNMFINFELISQKCLGCRVLYLRTPFICASSFVACGCGSGLQQRSFEMLLSGSLLLSGEGGFACGGMPWSDVFVYVCVCVCESGGGRVEGGGCV